MAIKEHGMARRRRDAELREINEEWSEIKMA
jgi:hypothetical protein